MPKNTRALKKTKSPVSRSTKKKHTKNFLRYTLVASLVLFFILVLVFLYKKSAKDLDTMVTSTGTFTYISNYDLPALLKCAPMADNTDKATCYKKALKPTLSSNPTILTFKALRDSNFKYMEKFLSYYGNTNYGDWRSVFWGNPAETDLQYYRTLCNTGATQALYYRIKSNNNSTDWLNLTNRLMAAFDEYSTYWGKPGAAWDWNSPVAAYDCGVFASLMWDKIQPDSSRSAATKRALIRSKLLHRADYILTYQNAGQFPAKQATEIKNGNSQGEEAAWTGAFLNLMYYLYPSAPNAANYRKNAIWLADFSQTICDDTTKCVFTQTGELAYSMLNHGMYGHPQYALAVLGNNARGGLVDYTFASKRDRSAIPASFKVQSKSGYNFVNIFERQVSKIYSEEFGFNYPFTTLAGSYWDLENKKNCYDFSYMGYNGVCETGVRADFNSPLAFNMAFIIDELNTSKYRSADGFIGKYYDFENSKLATSTLYLPPVYNTSTKTWDYTPLSMAKKAKSPWGNKFITHSYYNNLYDNKVNWNFFVNSMKAFEHTLSFILLNPESQVLQRIDLY